MKQLTLALMTAALLAAGSAAAEAPKPTPAPVKKTELCPPATGSRLGQRPGPDGKCGNNLPGARSYDREDVERTGQTDVGRALQQIDPALSTGRGGR